jgi:hypothetical protein
MTLLFSESDHRYFMPEMPEVKFTSVTKLIGMYHEEFDLEKMAERTAKKRGVTAEEIKAEWAAGNKASLDRGHLYHAHKEEKAYKRKDKPIFKAEITQEGYKKAFDITDLKPGVYPELIVYLPEFGVLGTSDHVEIYEDFTFDVEDYKTNKKLEFTGYPVWNPKTMQREPKKMLTPLQHLDDCHGIHYSLQLSLYAYMLEEAGYTLRPNGLKIHHALFDESSNSVDLVTYPLNYLRKEVISLLKHFKQNNSKR